MKSTVSGFNLLVLALLGFCSQGQAADIHVAVASNFLAPLQQLAQAYEQTSGDRIIISAGSTGKLYAQIVNGAPFDIFLAANSREPTHLESDGYTVAGSRFTYARGRLVLWEPSAAHQQANLEDVLRENNFQHLALANPVTAPYGAAAMSVLQHFALQQTLADKIIRGENVSQTYQFVATGAAELGFVALSQIKSASKPPQGKVWMVAENLHEPILQQAVLIKASSLQKQAQAFLDYLQGEKARAMIENFGYGLP